MWKMSHSGVTSDMTHGVYPHLFCALFERLPKHYLILVCLVYWEPTFNF